MKIAIVVSRFNQHITERCLQAALETLGAHHISRDNIYVSWVPGAVELPLIAQQYASHTDVDAVICFGAVIRGETDHYEYVCQMASQGCQQVALTHNIPVIFGVLTTDNEAQALARVGGDRGHIGKEYAQSAIEMVNLMQSIKVKEEISHVE